MPIDKRRSTRARVAVGAALTAALAATTAVTLAGPDASAHQPVVRTTQKAKVHRVKVRHSYFGVHDRYRNSLKRQSTGSIRAWDSGTGWDDMQPDASAAIDFSILDQIVRRAWANHTQVTFVAAMTPSWALAQPVPADATSPSRTYPPTATAYAQFLQQVMERYRDYQGSGRPGIANYQVWNEANVTTFWNGDDEQLAGLVKAAYDVRQATDPEVRIIAPPMVTRLRFEQKAALAFYRTTVGPNERPVWKYVDAIALNLYPTQTMATSRGGTRASTPEDAIALLHAMRGYLDKANVPRSLPIWDTEINYGMGRTATTVPVSEARQTANVIRTYLLNAAQGIKQVDWYAYDMHTLPGGGTLGNTLLTDPTDPAAGTLTRAGKAFTMVQKWMDGTMIGTTTKRPCIKDRHGTYTCKVKYSTGVGRIYWNPFKTVRVRVVSTARKKVNEYNVTSRIKGLTRIKVDYRPVLVKSTR